MARGKRSKKTQPVVRHLLYQINTAGSAGTQKTKFLDLAKGLSHVNRRLYRQGRHYKVRRINFTSNYFNEPGNAERVANRVNVSVVPPSWVAANAWRRGFDTWMAHRKDLLKQTGTQGLEAAYADFKVYLNNQHRTDEGSTFDLMPVDQSGNTVNQTGAEWKYSEVVSEVNAGGSIKTHDLHMLGDHATNDDSVGLIKSYGETRATVRSQMPGDDAVDNSDPLLRVGAANQNEASTVMGDIRDNNDSPPYAIDNYPGDDANMPGALVVQQGVIDTGDLPLGGFVAMCGLMRIDITTAYETENTIRMLVELAPGNYRGVDAEAI